MTPYYLPAGCYCNAKYEFITEEKLWLKLLNYLQKPHDRKQILQHLDLKNKPRIWKAITNSIMREIARGRILYGPRRSIGGQLFAKNPFSRRRNSLGYEWDNYYHPFKSRRAYYNFWGWR